MILTKGTKEVLINDVSASFQVSFFKPDAANANKEVAATATDGTHLRIKGFGDFYLNTLTDSQLLQRARPEVLGVSSVDAAVAAQITVAGTNLAGPVSVLLRQTSSDPLPEYISGEPGRYFKQRTFTFNVPANVTAAQFLALLNTEINTTATLFPEADEPIELQVTSSITGTVLNVTCQDSHVKLDLRVDDLDGKSNTIITVLKSVQTVANDEGRNIYRILKGGRLQTEGTNAPYAVSGPLELPLRGARYTSIFFTTLTQRPDLTGHSAADSTVATRNKFMAYISESAANEATIQAVINFLARADASVIKSYSNKFLDNTTKALFLSNTAI